MNASLGRGLNISRVRSIFNLANLYDYMMEVVQQVPPGSNGVLFTPWLHGNRCPFEDSHARGMFFNIGIETGKTELIHAVLEGVCYHLRWMLEAQERKVKTSEIIRFVGGGALSPVTCQCWTDRSKRWPIRRIPERLAPPWWPPV